MYEGPGVPLCTVVPRDVLFKKKKKKKKYSNLFVGLFHVINALGPK